MTKLQQQKFVPHMYVGDFQRRCENFVETLGRGFSRLIDLRAHLNAGHPSIFEDAWLGIDSAVVDFSSYNNKRRE